MHLETTFTLVGQMALQGKWQECCPRIGMLVQGKKFVVYGLDQQSRGGGLQNGRAGGGGQVKFYPYKKGGQKCFNPVLREGGKKFVSIL